jgi:hypothetical protein
VRDSKGEEIYQGESARDAVMDFRRNISARMYISVWQIQDEDLYQVIEPIDITPVILQTIVSVTGGANGK